MDSKYKAITSRFGVHKIPLFSRNHYFYLLAAFVFIAGCGVQDINSRAIASGSDNAYEIFLGTEGDLLFPWMNNLAAIRDPLAAGLGQGVKVEIEDGNMDNIVKKCIAVSSGVSSYESRFFLKDFTSDNAKVKEKNFIFIEWYMEYEKPDNFLVEQTAWAEYVADRWISLGDNHYFMIRAWHEDPHGDSRKETNAFLTLEKYTNLMQNNTIESAEKYRKGEVEFIVLRYTPNNLNAFFMDAKQLRGKDCQAEIWIDKDYLIIATSIRINNEHTSSIEYRQLFASYNRKFNIKKPINPLRIKSK